MAQRQKSGKYIKFLIYMTVVVLVNVAGTTLCLRLDASRFSVVVAVSRWQACGSSMLAETLAIAAR